MNGWGVPVYQLNSATTSDGTKDIQLFLFKVCILLSSLIFLGAGDSTNLFLSLNLYLFLCLSACQLFY